MKHRPIWRLTPPERLNPAKPECCEAPGKTKSTLTTNTGLDPILFADQHTGRTFASNSTVGANAVYAYSDNDGDAGSKLVLHRQTAVLITKALVPDRIRFFECAA